MPTFDGEIAIVAGAAENLEHAVGNAVAARGAGIAFMNLAASVLEAARTKLPVGDASDTSDGGLIAPGSWAEMINQVPA